MLLQGVGVSPGVGIGRAVVIAEGSLDYTQVHFAGVQQEKARLRTAVQAFAQRTQAMADALRARLDGQEADILASQIEAARKAVEKSGVRLTDIEAVGITSQRETTLLWERETQTIRLCLRRQTAALKRANARRPLWTQCVRHTSSCLPRQATNCWRSVPRT